jgi:hypothetical protein
LKKRRSRKPCNKPANVAPPTKAQKVCTPGPKPSITAEVVQRVSDRVGRGMPLKMALEAEAQPKINVETWHKAIQGSETFRAVYDAGRAQFLDAAMARLAAADELKYLCWLLERRHSDLFAKREPEVVVNNTNVHNAIPEDVYKLAKEIAQRDAKVRSEGGTGKDKDQDQGSRAH